MSKRKASAHAGPHKYKRIAWKTRLNPKEAYHIFKCMLAGCTHYVPKDLVVGNETLCWRCGRVFQMTSVHTAMAKPHCVACTKPKSGEASVSDVMSNLDKILGRI